MASLIIITFPYYKENAVTSNRFLFLINVIFQFKSDIYTVSIAL